jgi:hypothetical protein
VARWLTAIALLLALAPTDAGLHGQPPGAWRPNGPPTLPKDLVSSPLPERPAPIEDPHLRRVSVEPPGAVAVARAAAALAVEVTGPDRTVPGEPLPSTLIVRNLGQAVAADVRVQLPLPPGARLLAAEPTPTAEGDRLNWALGAVEAGGERRVRVTVLPGVAGECQLCPAATFTAAGGLRTRLEKPSLSVTQSAPETARPGETVAIQIEVANGGPLPLRRVGLRARLSEGLKHAEGRTLVLDLGDLPAGEARKVRLDVGTGAPGPQSCEVEATAAGGHEARSRHALSVATPVLAVRLSGPEKLEAGGEAEYRMEVGGLLTPGRLALTLPEGLEVVAVSAGGGREGGQVVWALEPPEAGRAVAAVARLRALQPGDWSVRAAATAQGVADTFSGLRVVVSGAPGGLRLELKARDKTLEVGAETVYEAHVKNTGAVAVRGIRLAVGAPVGLGLLAGEGPTMGRQEGPQAMTFEPLPALAPHGEAVYLFRIRGAQPGTWAFQASAQADGPGKPAREQLAGTVYADKPGGKGP